MMMKKWSTRIYSSIIAIWLLMCVSCNPYPDVPKEYHHELDIAFQKAGSNEKELKNALASIEPEYKTAAAFLIANMPDRDLKSISANYLKQNIEWAYKAKIEFPWAKDVPDSIFLNNILPYALINERRDEWRKDFYERFSKYVRNCTTVETAIDSINKNILNEVEVIYSTERPKADQSPFESMDCGLASCSGLSILLADAFRSVGIPARFAGTPLWTTVKGNHSWVEVWIRGKWYFTEYYPDKELNRSWFVERAGKANPEKPIHWVYATSFKKTDLTFPLVWNESIDYVYAENVTERYIQLYNTQKREKAENENKVILSVHLFNKKNNLEGNNRVKQQIYVISEQDTISSFMTAGSQDDMNNFKEIFLNKNSLYQIHYVDSKKNKNIHNFQTDTSDFRINLFIENEDY